VKRTPLPTLDDASQRLLDQHLAHLRNRHLSPAFVDQRRRVLIGLVAWLGHPLADVTLDDLDRWQTEALVTRTTGRSRNTVVSHVREFYRWCHAVEEATSDDRGRRLVRARQARLVPRPIRDGSLTTALAAAPPRVRPMLYLAAYEGLRACEIANLRREDVLDGDDPPSIVVLGKGNKERVLPLSAPVLVELQRHGMPRRGPIFTMRDARGRTTTRPITAHRVSATCNDYLAEVGAGASLHQLRHFFGSALYRASRDLRLVQEAMGHSSPATTAVYAAFDQRSTAGYMAQVASMLAQGPPAADPRPTEVVHAVGLAGLPHEDPPAPPSAPAPQPTEGERRAPVLRLVPREVAG
jgi:integrase/recombinase XerC